MDIPDLSSMFSELVKIAKADGVYSDEERSIITRVRDDVKEFVAEYREAIKDGTISSSEHSALLSLWHRIYDNSKKLAIEDGVLTDDENQLLLRICQTILDRC